MGEYSKMLVQYPGSWDVTDQYQEYLMRIEKYEEVRSLMNGWLDRKVPSFGLDRIDAKTAIASSYYKERRYEEGFRVIEPEISSWKGNAMAMGAKLLNELGRESEAEKILRVLVDRYPDDASARALLAEQYWRFGKYKEAAEFLKQSQNRLPRQAWLKRIGPGFVEVFCDKPKEKAIAAFSELLANGHDPYNLWNIPYHLAKKGLNELAFVMCSQLRPPKNSLMCNSLSGLMHISKNGRGSPPLLTGFAGRYHPGWAGNRKEQPMTKNSSI